MNHDETAERLITIVKSMEGEYNILKEHLTDFLVGALRKAQAEIAACESKDDLLAISKALADKAYAGNAITEPISDILINIGVNVINSKVLDVKFGNDWDVKFKAWVASL